MQFPVRNVPVPWGNVHALSTTGLTAFNSAFNSTVDIWNMQSGALIEICSSGLRLNSYTS